MMGAFEDGGIMMWALTLAAVLMIGLSARAILSLRGESRDVAGAMASADAALFWGACAGLLGVLGTLIGIMQAARLIQMAGQVDPSLAWAGLGITLITTVYGLLILLMALIIWGILRLAGRRAGGAATA